MKSRQEITTLFKRYLANECSEEEEQIFLDLLGSKKHGQLIRELIATELKGEVGPSFKELPLIKAELSRVKENIIRQIGETEVARSISWSSWWMKAAAVLLFCTGAVLFVMNKEKKTLIADLAPGGNKATLTLADGSKILLDTALKGNLVNQAGVQITKADDGQLVYTIGKGSEVNNRAGILLTNTISTPRGGQYQVNLPDGTKVWLNAASILKFPLNFLKLKERRVELQGEAYFEVKKDARKPFIVESERQVLQVLGTHFNVNSYRDDRDTKTTLLEGAVKVSPLNGPSATSAILKPGQQAQISSASGAVKVLNVDASAEIAWKNGLFFFENEPIENIMKQISRWYNVEVVYEENMTGKTVWGSVTRYGNVSKVLSILELTGEIHFKIEGRRITVHK